VTVASWRHSVRLFVKRRNGRTPSAQQFDAVVQMFMHGHFAFRSCSADFHHMFARCKLARKDSTGLSRACVHGALRRCASDSSPRPKAGVHLLYLAGRREAGVVFGSHVSRKMFAASMLSIRPTMALTSLSARLKYPLHRPWPAGCLPGWFYAQRPQGRSNWVGTKSSGSCLVKIECGRCRWPRTPNSVT